MAHKIWETLQVLGPFLELGLWTRACPLLHSYLFEGSIDKGLHKRGFPDPLSSNDEDITGGHLPPPPQPESHFSPASIILRTPVPTQVLASIHRHEAHLWQTDGCSHTQSGHSPPAPLSHGQRSIAWSTYILLSGSICCLILKAFPFVSFPTHLHSILLIFWF